jgi:MFS family permease
VKKKMDNERKQPILTKDFALIAIINLLIFCGFQMLLPTLPLYVDSLGGTDTVIGWLTGFTTIACLIIRPFSGIYLDRYGRKGIFLAGIGAIIIITLAYLFFPIIGMILALRFLHGLGWGVASTSGSTVATDVIPKERFGEGMGLFTLFTSLAMALAPSIGLSVLTKFHVTGLMILSAGFGALALLLAFFIRYRQVKKKETIKEKMAPYERSAIRPSIIIFFVSASFGSITGFVSLYAVDRGVDNIGMFFMIYAVAVVVSRLFFGRLIDRLGFNIAMYPGLVGLIAAMFILYQAFAMPLFLITAFLYGVGFGAVQSSLQTMAVINASKDRLGAANATFFTGFDGGIGFGAVIGGIVASG